jgi:hypothetical protein
MRTCNDHHPVREILGVRWANRRRRPVAAATSPYAKQQQNKRRRGKERMLTEGVIDPG